MLVSAGPLGLLPLATDVAALLDERDPLPREAGIDINRKMLADLAVNDKAAFTGLVEKAKAAL